MKVPTERDVGDLPLREADPLDREVIPFLELARRYLAHFDKRRGRLTLAGSGRARESEAEETQDARQLPRTRTLRAG
jgi:hypothetical protein